MKPTQAQREAVIKAIQDNFGISYAAMAEAAITAAAETAEAQQPSRSVDTNKTTQPIGTPNLTGSDTAPGYLIDLYRVEGLETP